jgi:V-type H+-transporting ATPase subunit E
MDAAQVKKQLDNMEAFILREAKDKQQEILDKAEEEFTMQKTALVQTEKQKIKKEFERRIKKVETDKKIAHSKELNQSRLKILKAREDIVYGFKERAQERLVELGRPGKEYEKLLKDLIVQGLLKLQETNISLRCRREDEAMVQTVLSAAVADYKSRSTKDCKVVIDTANYLPPAPRGGETQGRSCCGGVVLSAHEGKILCDNTLDQRLSLAFDAKIPEIRRLVFSA